MKPATVKRLRLLALAIGVVLFVALAAGAWFYTRLRSSLPQLDGSAKLAGLGASVTVERDALGVPTIHGDNRNDVARALGFLHAQDRFFQMDCTRRHAAGELAEIFGKAALPHDRQVRIHDFRTLARTVLTRLPADQQALLQAYTAGVNAGLAALGEKPFEYILLRETPRPWSPEDSILMIYAMALDLQDEDAVYERSLSALNDTLTRNAVDYFAPLIGPIDAALDGSTAPLAPMPTERMIDVRRRVYEYETDKKKQASRTNTESPDVLPGSNAIALAGMRTASGAGLVANDMHLALRVPNIWYRVSLVFPASSQNGGQKTVTGVTLPGSPVIVAGSNGSIAWGFTNSYADTVDLVVVNSTSVGPNTYAVVGDVAQYERRTATLQVRGEKPETIDYLWTIWGPIVGKNSDKRDLALKWTLHDPDVVNFNILALEDARDVQSAIDIAHRTGIPPQNLFVADSSGAIGWTICGRLPQRQGFDGRLHTSWNFGDRKWIGLLPPESVPALIAPADGQLWSGNQRKVSGEKLNLIGDGGYEYPMRAARIHELLGPLGKATPRDLLAIQLDVRAPHLGHWQQLLLQLLKPEATATKADRAKLRAAVESWDGLASADSVGYRLVAAFRQNVVKRVLPVVFEPCYDAYPDFNYRHFNYEPALREMIEKRPPHLLGQQYLGWDELLLAAVDDTIVEVKKEHGSIARAAWGDHNAAQIRHPLARLFPGVIGHWLTMPADPLPGGKDMPRVQSPDNGASERFAVSPGHEAEGIFHMPGGQSGHPLSPYFRAGHDAWVKGEPTPFLPGPPTHTLTLAP
ncbi:MAG: penicillin acylase family protein [Nibricoccus sp.]